MLLDSLFPALVRYWVYVGVGVVILAVVHSCLLLITANKHSANVTLDCVCERVCFLNESCVALKTVVGCCGSKGAFLKV